MFKYLTEKGIPTPLTYHDFDEFKKGVDEGKISFSCVYETLCVAVAV